MSLNNLKIGLLWFLIAVGFLLHGVYHVYDLFFGIDITLENATGEVPVGKHFFRIFLEVVTYTMVLMTLYITKKEFYWFSFVWSFLLGIMNTVHLGGTLVKDYQNLSQVALLIFILATNILLVFEIWKIIKVKKER